MSASDSESSAGAPSLVNSRWTRSRSGGTSNSLVSPDSTWTTTQRSGGNARPCDPASSESLQPEFAANPWRSEKPEYLVLVGICTHLGCSPNFFPSTDAEGMGSDWQGGFYCPCHGSKFDLSGRVYAGVPAPTNMEVPPYHYVDDTHLVIGELEEGAA